MTGLLDGLLALFVAAALNLVVIYNIRSRTPPSESGFLVRVYSLDDPPRGTRWPCCSTSSWSTRRSPRPSGETRVPTTLGGYQLSLKWSGEPITTAYMSTAVSGYGWVYFVGSHLLRLRPQSAARAAAERPDGRPHGPGDLCDRRKALRPLLGALGGPLHGVLPADGLLVDRDVQGPRDPALHRRGDVCRRRASREAVDTAWSACSWLRKSYSSRCASTLPISSSSLRWPPSSSDSAAERFEWSSPTLFSGRFLFGALNVAVKQETLEQQTTYMSLERLQITRGDQAMWGSSGFGQEYDVSTPAGALATLPIGLVYLLFAPFPWAVSGLRQALVVPETLVWYALMPAFVRGLAFGLRRQFRAILPIRGLRGEPDPRLRPDAGQHRNRIPAAHPGHHVLLHLHGRRDRREASSACRELGAGGSRGAVSAAVTGLFDGIGPRTSAGRRERPA